MNLNQEAMIHEPVQHNTSWALSQITKDGSNVTSLCLGGPTVILMEGCTGVSSFEIEKIHPFLHSTHDPLNLAFASLAALGTMRIEVIPPEIEPDLYKLRRLYRIAEALQLLKRPLVSWRATLGPRMAIPLHHIQRPRKEQARCCCFRRRLQRVILSSDTQHLKITGYWARSRCYTKV
jgi:hypothetical protein